MSIQIPNEKEVKERAQPRQVRILVSEFHGYGTTLQDLVDAATKAGVDFKELNLEITSNECYGDIEIEGELCYNRMETPEEVAKRIADDADARRRQDDRERAELQRLKAKFGV